MKPDIRWQVLLALSGLALVLMLLSYQVQSAALCMVSVPATGGTFIEGIIGRPQYLNPLLSDNYPVDRELTSLIFEGLVSFDEAGQAVPALAEAWSVSEDGLTYTFTLKDNLTWHDGQPVTTSDVAFTYGLMQDEAFPGLPSLKQLWQSITITPIDERRISFSLTQPYAPFLEATSRGILPAHLLTNINSADLTSMAFNLSPVGTGPFVVQSGQDWSVTGRLRLTPNPTYWREGTNLNDVEFRFYPDADSVVAAFQSGEIHAINDLSPTFIPVLNTQADSRVFTSIAPRYSAVLFNLSDTGAPAIQIKEVRQAIAYALDRSGLIDEVLEGQGVEFEGPYLPDNWASRPDLVTSYSFQPDTARMLLDTAGWSGEGVRSREGQPLVLHMVLIDQPAQRAIGEAIVNQLAAVGFDVQMTPYPTGDSYRQSLSEREFDLALVEIAPTNDPDLYDFWSQEATIRGQNYGGWNNRRASEALETGRQLSSQGERAAYYEAFLRHFDSDLPALTLYQHTATYVLNSVVQQAEIGRIWHPIDKYKTFGQWHINLRDITVSCPSDSAN